jgi:hypothetical protein
MSARSCWCWSRLDMGVLTAIANMRQLDYVLACECIVPRLYPIEPLVHAIHALSGPHTVTLVAYEHRERAFSPQARFAELAGARGLEVESVSTEEMDPVYQADDIELWRVRRRCGDA